jgi:hypothetical protein
MNQCCGGKSTSIKIDRPISKEIISYLAGFGFRESEHFTQNGILYVQNDDITLNGAMGSNTISVKCRSSNCENSLDELEKILLNFG